jgi:predicted transposase YdaD
LSYAQTILEYTQKNKKIRQALEELMVEHFKDPFIAGYVEQGRTEGLMEGRQEGRQEALVSVLFAILAARSFTVIEQVRAVISACADPAQLERWAARAATAKTIDEVFA